MMMTIGTALLTIAVGAILKFAVTANLSGLDIGTVGVILMIAGTAGMVIGLGRAVASGESGGRSR